MISTIGIMGVYAPQNMGFNKKLIPILLPEQAG